MKPLAERIEQTNRLVLVAVLNNAPDKIATLEDTQDILSLWKAVADEANKHVKLWEQDIEQKNAQAQQDRYFPLSFEQHHLSPTALRAEVSFDNGYSVSIGCGGMFYSNAGEPNAPDTTYEVAILYNGTLVYNSFVLINDEPFDTNDVIGHLSQDQVIQVIQQVKNYDPESA